MGRYRASEFIALAHGSFTGRTWISHGFNGSGPWVTHESTMCSKCGPIGHPLVFHALSVLADESPMGRPEFARGSPVGCP